MYSQRASGRKGIRAAAAVLAAALFWSMLLSPLRGFAAETAADAAAETAAVFPAAEAFSAVSLSRFAGTVTIRSGEEYGVSYEGEDDLRPSVSYEEGQLRIEGNWEPEANEEETGLSGDSAAADGEGTGGSALCSLVISVPAGTALTSVCAEQADTLILTDVTVTTVYFDRIAGDICCKNVSLGQGEMHSEEGNIQLDGGAFHNLLLASAGGNIYVSSAEGLARSRVTASAEKGSVTVGGAVRGKTYRQNGNGKRYLTIRAQSGSVVLFY